MGQTYDSSDPGVPGDPVPSHSRPDPKRSEVKTFLLVPFRQMSVENDESLQLSKAPGSSLDVGT